MTRTEFLTAVAARCTELVIAGDPEDAEHLSAVAHDFADTVALYNAGLPPCAALLDYRVAVVVDGTHDRLVFPAHVYDGDRVWCESRVGVVTSVVRGADLLAGRIGPQPDVSRDDEATVLARAWWEASTRGVAWDEAGEHVRTRHVIAARRVLTALPGIVIPTQESSRG